MLPKQYRITKNEIPLVARKGRKIESNGFYMKFIPNDSLENSRFGIIIPKKVISLATKRNRVKRVFRAVIWDFIKADYFKQKGMYVFFVNSPDMFDVELNLLKDRLEESIK